MTSPNDSIEGLEGHLSDALSFFLTDTDQQISTAESELYRNIQGKARALVDDIIRRFNQNHSFQTEIWKIIHNASGRPWPSQPELRINNRKLRGEIIKNLKKILNLQENRAIIQQFLEQTTLELSKHNQQLPIKRKSGQHDEGPSIPKRLRYDERINSDQSALLNELKQSIQDLLNQQTRSDAEDLEGHLSDALSFFLIDQQISTAESELYRNIQGKARALVDDIIRRFNQNHSFQTEIWKIIHNASGRPWPSQPELRINNRKLRGEIIKNLKKILSLQENRAIIQQFLEQTTLELSKHSQQLPIKRKSSQHDEGPSISKRLRYDERINSDQSALLNELKQSIQDLLNKQTRSYTIDNIKRLFERYSYKNPHLFFSLCYNSFSKDLQGLPNVATELATLWIKLLDSNTIGLKSQQISDLTQKKWRGS